MTIVDAAEQIGCKREYIYELFKHNKLSGPTYPGRAPRNAARVHQSSIDTYLVKREDAAQRGRHRRGDRPNAEIGDRAILERLDELTRINRENRQQQRSRRNSIVTHLGELVALTAQTARDQAASVQSLAKALGDAHTLVAELSDLVDSDDDIIDQVLAGYRDVLTALVERERTT
ncbi:hypothetical protein OS122_30260 [Mycolicibacterium mucogenicum]|uniref:hypothetical protein n=1 Tax=Mycolicibacterium mucogenicum TaxID=56689 RepID=UPI00226A6ABA|nr:hypothetical protein [Mycolicibacterium mucogenicum]MCX8565171.1 hypothetical protein [Mycolicibacterium mucogenicum]